MAAAPAIADIHHRQPLILEEEAMESWLEPGQGRKELIAMARSGCASTYDRRPVSGLVNSPRNDPPELPEPAMKSVPTGGEARHQLALL